MTGLAGSDTFTANPSVRTRELDDELILLDLDAGEYFSLNATGRDVWSELLKGSDLATIQATLGERWAVPAETAVAVIEELVRELLHRKLIARVP